jgi:uroporphyrinogen-III decarboxylase
MNSRERLQRGIAGQATDVKAVAPAYLSLYLAERQQAIYVQAYRDRLAQGATSIDHAVDSRLRAEAILGAYQIFSEVPDWIHTEIGESKTWAELGEMHTVAGRLTYVDGSSGETRDMQDPRVLMLPGWTGDPQQVRTGEADLWDASAGLDTRAEVDALAPIHTAEDLDAQGLFDVTRVLARTAGDRLSVTWIASTPFWSTYSILGFQGMMIMMREKPQLFRYLMERRHWQRLEMLKGLARAGLHSVWIEECLSSADLISPSDYEQFAFPPARDFIADANRLGLRTVLYYCGDVIPRLPWLRRLGMAALAVEESKKGFTVDIADVIAGLNGVCCVYGNVDAIRVVCEGTTQEIEAEVRRQIVLGRQARGFVLSQGSPFPLETDPRKIDDFTRAARQFQD